LAKGNAFNSFKVELNLESNIPKMCKKPREKYFQFGHSGTMHSLTTNARQSIREMAGERPKTSVRLHNPISEDVVQVFVGPKDTQEEVKHQIQDALGISPEYITLKHNGSIISDGDLGAILSLPEEKRVIIFEENLDGGIAINCGPIGGVTCCLPAIGASGTRFGAQVGGCCCSVGKSPWSLLGDDGWGCSSQPFAITAHVTCCRFCLVHVGQHPLKRYKGSLTKSPVYSNGPIGGNPLYD
jgi:hypothetical protein